VPDLVSVYLSRSTCRRTPPCLQARPCLQALNRTFCSYLGGLLVGGARAWRAGAEH
jgi:hypothetical protein